MDSDNLFETNIIEDVNFDKNFLDIICEKAQSFCKPTSFPSPDEEFQTCNNFFQDLENLIIGTYDVDALANSSPNLICGKIFKQREPVYLCRDCSTDDTCVFCRVCFMKSEHVKHNYEMHISSGGGYCDCGDEEAWKTFPRCNIHGGSSSNSTITTMDSLEEVDVSLKVIPDNVKIRFLKLCKVIFDNFNRFVMRPLCRTNQDKRIEELKKELEFVATKIPRNKPNELCLVLYNNEFHNFDQVITLFKRCLQCLQDQAMAFANIVDRDGRCMALMSCDKDDVENKQNDILSRSKIQTSMELLCRIHHPLIFSLQTFLIHTLQWLYEFVDRYPRLRMLLCQYLFTETDLHISDVVFKRCTFVQDIFENHIEMWKSARNVCSKFLITAIFKETFFKRLFVVEMSKNYKMVMDHFANDDHNAEDSLISLNCQIFTIISFAKYLLESHNILENIMKIIYETLFAYSKPLRHPKIKNKTILHFEKEEHEIHKKFDPFERRMRSLNDLKFLLTSLLTAYSGDKEIDEIKFDSDNSMLWTENATENFMKYFCTFADFLSLIQDTDTIERVTEHHVEHDPNWKTGIMMMYDSVQCLTLTAQLLMSNRLCWDRAFAVFRQVVKTRILDLECGYSTKFILFSYSALVIDNEWPSKYMSAIKPLHRFMAALLIDKNHRDLLNSMEKDCLLDQALQMVVFASQQAGNMWIRNGSVPYILTQQIKCLALTSEMFDRDLQLIQQIAICISPDKFILKCIHKFDLKSYFEGHPCKQPDKKALLQRVEDFLHTLIMTIFFRHRVSVGKSIAKEDIYAHIIFHILCIKPISHSKLMKKLNPALQKYPKGNLMDIIAQVADQSLNSQVVIFSAKKSLLMSRFDRYSPYYSIQDRNEAELWVQNCFKKDELPTAMNPPMPIDLADDCVALYDYSSNECFAEILNKILYFCITKRNGEFWTDAILDMVLYLIGSSLLEDIKVLEKCSENARPLFIDTVTKESLSVDIIGNLELLCDKITCDHQLELIKWTIRKWNDVIKMKTPGSLAVNATDNNMDTEMVEKESASDYAQVLQQAKIAKADAAKKRREQLMSKMWNMQKKFINENSELLVDNFEQTNEAGATKDIVDPQLKPFKERDLTCILCQERNNEDSKDRPIVLIAGAWRSAVLAKHPFINKVLEPSKTPGSLMMTNSFESNFEELNVPILPTWSNTPEEDGNEIDRIAMRSVISMLDHAEETFITTCGHVMHYDCKTSYMKDMVKQRQNIARTKGVLYPRIYNRCPLCKCVCNIDIPIIKSDLDNDNIVTNGTAAPTISFQAWINGFIRWVPTITCHSGSDVKKVDGSIRWWNKLGNHLSNLMKLNSSMKGNDSSATDEDLISCLAYRTSLAIKLQPAKLTKDTYKNFENVRSSISESSSQELIELDYAVIYTLSVWDKIMTKQNLSLLLDVPERHADGLKCLINAVCKSHKYFVNSESVSRECQSFFMFLRQMLFDCNTVNFRRAWLDLNKYQVPLFILEVDFTYVLGSLLFLRNSLSTQDDNSHQKEFLDRQNYNFHVVRFIYQFASVQALSSLQNVNVDNIDVALGQLKSHSPDIWTNENINNLYILRESLGCQFRYRNRTNMRSDEVAVCFSRSLLPFLRIAAFLLNEMGSITLPTSFAHYDAEFNDLIRILNLDLVPFDSQPLPYYIDNHLKLISGLKLSEPKTFWNTPLPHIIPEPLPKLIDLPREFTDVITMALDRGCSLSQQATGTVSEMSICLICGITVCLSGYCCRRTEESSGIIISGAQIHSRQCHEGYSLFLNTRNSKVVVFFYQARWQISLDPVYLDKFGETDVDLKRGYPLYLNSESYAKLERSWLDHSIGCIVNDGFFSNDFFV